MGAFDDIAGSILCPVDFSDDSAGAIRYGAVIAAAAGRPLFILTVEDPLLTEAMDIGAGVPWSPADCRRDLVSFTRRALEDRAPADLSITYDVRVGRPALEILRYAADCDAALIVMSTHGLTGVRKLFFGSTTERVLRETPRPVLVTPAGDKGPSTAPAALARLHRILVPVDLSEASDVQAVRAGRVAAALGLPVIVAHVIKPMRTRLALRLNMTGLESDRRSVAEERLAEITALLPASTHPEPLLAYGDAAEELSKVVQDRGVGLIVVGLQGTPTAGARMGSVTYRILCLTPTLTLALPPLTHES